MKQIIRLAALALLLMLLPGRAFAEPEAVEQAKSSVVQLYAMGYDGDGRLLSRWTGTAFAVGPAGEDSSVFLTNRHVALGRGEFTEDTVKLWLLPEKKQMSSLWILRAQAAMRNSCLLWFAWLQIKLYTFPVDRNHLRGT